MVTRYWYSELQRLNYINLRKNISRKHGSEISKFTLYVCYLLLNMSLIN